MSLTDQEIKSIKSIVNLGAFTQSILTVISFAIRRNKVDLLKKLEAVLQEFESGLTEDEKREFLLELDAVLKSKVDGFVKDLDSNFSKEEVENILSHLTSDLPPAPEPDPQEEKE